MHADNPLAPPRRIDLEDLSELRIGRGRRTEWRRPARAGDLDPSLRLLDPRMSTRHAKLQRTRSGWLLEDCASKNGTYVNGAAVSCARLHDGDVIELGATTFVFRAVPRPAPALATVVAAATWTQNAGVAADLARAVRAARAALPVLITGEVGAGKEMAARVLHTAAGRPGPLVTVSCAELSAATIGRWAAAAGGDRCGDTELARAAGGGTLLLDELAELSPAAQAELVELFRTTEATPHELRSLDLQLVGSTDRDLGDLVAQGAFRADLYGRLTGFELRTRPLRDRREDLGLLCAALLRRVDGARAPRLRLQRQAARALFAHDWPGNLRQLDHVLRAALAVADDDEIRVAHLPLGLGWPATRGR
jgi:transcriptional regulator of acetoin/glycerol metabolism